MSHPVYILEFVGVPLNHVALFVETTANGAGTQFHVIGTILQGMTFEMKEATPSEAAECIESATTLVGHVNADMMGRLEEVCRAVPPPESQVTLSGARKDMSKRLRRCGEWVEEVKVKLLDQGIVNCKL